MPYNVRQRPGPRNAPGMIKFIFPNQHFVFLHDTPQRELFERRARNFGSSGMPSIDRHADAESDEGSFITVDSESHQPRWLRDGHRPC